MGERSMQVKILRSWRGLGDGVRAGRLRAMWDMRFQSLRNDLGVLAGLLWHLMDSGKEGIIASQACAFVSMV